MNDDGVKKNNDENSDEKANVSYASNVPISDLFKKLYLFSGSDEFGRYWEIESRKGSGELYLSPGSDDVGRYWGVKSRKISDFFFLRESDLKELHNWISCELKLDSRSSIFALEQIDGILNFHTLDKAGNPEDQSTQRKVVRALRYLEKKIAVLEAEKQRMMSAKWRTYDVPDNFDDMLIAEVELSSGEKEFYLCVIGDDGMMMDPESRDDLGWDVECISRWIPFDEFLTWANGGES